MNTSPESVGDGNGGGGTAVPCLRLPSWFSVKHDGDVATVGINGEIGIGTAADDLLAEVGDAPSVEFFISSFGGSTRDAFKIFDGLSGRVTVATIIGQCYSAACIIAFSAKTLRMEAGSRMMIHPAVDFVLGQESQLRFRADVLAKINARQRELLWTRTDRAAELLSGPDFYFTAEEALAAGLVDEVFALAALIDQPAPAIDPAPILPKGPTDDERLLQTMLNAFGVIQVRNRNEFVRGLMAWAVHASREE